MIVFFGEGHDISACLINIFTGSKVSHAGLIYDYPNENEVLHSTIGGVQMTTLDKIKEKYDRFFKFQCLFVEARTAADMVKAKFLGARYDYLSYIGLGLAILFRLKKNPLGLHKQLMCTEVIAHWLNYVNQLNSNLEIPYHDPEMMTPIDMMNFILSRPDLFAKIQ